MSLRLYALVADEGGWTCNQLSHLSLGLVAERATQGRLVSRLIRVLIISLLKPGLLCSHVKLKSVGFSAKARETTIPSKVAT